MNPEKTHPSFWVRSGLVIAGSLSLILGIIGIFVPVLPTTPFLLLTAACYIRGSERLYHWFISRPCFGKLIARYHQGYGVPKRIKIAAISMLWTTIGVTVIFFIHFWWLRLLLLGIASAITVHIVKLKSYQNIEENRIYEQGKWNGK